MIPEHEIRNMIRTVRYADPSMSLVDVIRDVQWIDYRISQMPQSERKEIVNILAEARKGKSS